MYLWASKPLHRPLETADGLKVLTDQASILENCAEHFNTLLNQDSDADHSILQQLSECPPIEHLKQSSTIHDFFFSQLFIH